MNKKIINLKGLEKSMSPKEMRNIVGGSDEDGWCEQCCDYYTAGKPCYGAMPWWACRGMNGQC